MREIETARVNSEPECQPDCVTEISFTFRRVSRNGGAPPQEQQRCRKVAKILAGLVSFITAFLVPAAKLVKEIRSLIS